MNSLICESIRKGDLSSLAKFPLHLMSEGEREYISFVLNYRKKYDEIPTIDRVQKEFPYFVPFKASTLPLGDLFDQTMRRKVMQSVQREINSALVAIEEGKLPEEEIRKAMQVIYTSGQLDTYADYDRSEYFRNKRFPIGIDFFDRLTGGLAEAEVLAVIGRLGTGKSTLSHYITHNWWKNGHSILYVSNEMTTADVFARIDGFHGKFNPRIFRTESPDDPKVASIIKKLDAESKMEKYGNIIVPNIMNPTPSQIFTLAKDMAADLVVIDGIYLLASGGSPMGNNWERVMQISNQVKRNSKDTGIPCMTVTQIKRNAAGKAAAMYDTEDIAFSDSIGQDSDFILAIKPDEIEKTRWELQLIKNRFGPVGIGEAVIDFETMTLSDMSSMEVYSEIDPDEIPEGGRLW